MKKILFCVLLFAVLAIILGINCSPSNSVVGPAAATPIPPVIYTYASTSTTGDFTTWTNKGSGNYVAVWFVTDTNGNITKTIYVAAGCGAPQPGFAIQTCTVSISYCANGTEVCEATDAPSPRSNFSIFEIPGVVLYAQGLLGAGITTSLNVGYEMNASCPTSGTTSDYVFAQLGVDQPEIFGVYRVASDFSSIIQADFGIGPGTCGAGNPSGSCAATPAIQYLTGGGTGTGNVAINSVFCDGGITNINLANGSVWRANQSPTGFVVIDLPSGSGGLLGFPISAAAPLSQFSGMNFSGMAFPDNGPPLIMAATSGPVSGNSLPLSSIAFSAGGPHLMTNPTFVVPSTGSTLTSPAYPDFTIIPTGFTNNLLQTTYTNPLAIPGLYEMDGTAASDNGRVIVTANNLGGQIILMGAVYNWRNNSLGYTGTANVNTGAFIMMQSAAVTGLYTGSAIAGLPDISTITAAPSDTFIVDATGLTNVSRNHPYQGSASTCPYHNGAHLEFKELGVNYTIPVYAPLAGVVDSVTTCASLASGPSTTNDKYAINIAIANSGPNAVLFEYSLEPMGGIFCSIGVTPGTTNMTPTDNGFFQQYILVSAGQTVTKGQLIGYLYHPANVGDGTHVHFNLAEKNTNQFNCPNIFNSTVEASFTALFSNAAQDECGTTSFATLYGTTPNFSFCYMPGAGEDITGLEP